MHYFWASKSRPPFTAIIKLGRARILFMTDCISLKEESYTHGLRVRKSWGKFHFLLNYPFKLMKSYSKSKYIYNCPKVFYFAVLLILLFFQESWKNMFQGLHKNIMQQLCSTLILSCLIKCCLSTISIIFELFLKDQKESKNRNVCRGNIIPV